MLLVLFPVYIVLAIILKTIFELNGNAGCAIN